jgi:AcrR family transcriptional regulator
MTTSTRRRPLTRARVLDAAIAVADEQGIDALTLRRLAERLGVHPTSIYNHVPSKDAILDGLAERLIEHADLPTHCASWQEWLPAFAASLRQLAREHRGAFAVYTRRAAHGHAASEHLEAALDAFRRDGFPPLAANEAVAAIGLALMGLALNEMPEPGREPVPGLAHLEPERYPRISEAALAVPANTDGMWDVLVSSLIHGLQARRDLSGDASRRGRSEAVHRHTSS